MKYAVVFFVSMFLFGCTKNTPVTAESGVSSDPYSSEVISVDNELSLFAEASMTDSLFLTDAEKEGLVFMREEEKLARDVYIKMESVWQLRVFTNIKKSEQAHTTAVKWLLTRYNIPDPVVTDIPGVFSNPDLQNLYNTLVQRGLQSQTEALKVGRDIELTDIEDLDYQLHSVVQNPEVRRVYTNLRRASTFHLRAFSWWLPIPQSAM